MKIRLPITLCALLAACSTPADRITAALTESGVSAVQARCMGERLQDKLNVAQLKRLNELGKANRGQTNVSFRDLAKQLDRDGDPKLVAEVVGAGVGCLF